MTPDAFKGLQSPFASVLASLLNIRQTSNPAVSLGSGMTQGSGGVTAPGATGATAGYRQQTGWAGGGKDHDYASRTAQYGPAQPGHGTTANPQAGNPFAGWEIGEGGVLGGIPTYQGPLTADLSGRERNILDQINNRASNRVSTPSSRYLNQTINGNRIPSEMTPEQARNQVDRMGLDYSNEQSLADFARELNGAHQTTGYNATDNNPFVDAAIRAATRPITDDLQETLSRTLPGRFTQAGQFVQPGSSSAFDRAAAIASRGAANAMTDASSRISFDSFNAERGRQFDAQEGARGREDAALMAELQRRGDYGEAGRGREATAMRDLYALNSDARQRGLDRQYNAALAAPQATKAELDNMLANLQAQGLPRMVQDLGIERGIDQFNTQMNNLLQTLGISAGVTRPVIAQASSGKSSGFNLK